MIYASEEQRLKAYFNADAKYTIVPIPTPVDRVVATQFINAQVGTRLAPDQMSKLSRLAILHDLRESAQTFMVFLRRNEQETADYHRSAWTVIALAWIGSDDQRKFAQDYLHQLQNRAAVFENRLIMLDATEAFGPAEGTGFYRDWIEKELGRLRRSRDQYAGQNKTNEARGVQIQIDELEEHLNVRVAAVDRSNGIRSSVASLPGDARISRLAALYAGAEPSSPNLLSWAGFTLAQMANRNNASSPLIARQFLSVAKRYEAAERNANPQSGLIRARSLRAVEFFGDKIDDAARQWLTAQNDPGTDLLALRPQWAYH